jgi:hypothetical protein
MLSLVSSAVAVGTFSVFLDEESLRESQIEPINFEGLVFQIPDEPVALCSLGVDEPLLPIEIEMNIRAAKLASEIQILPEAIPEPK